MTSMDQIHRIRDLYYGQGKSLTEIAGIEKLDWLLFCTLNDTSFFKLNGANEA